MTPTAIATQVRATPLALAHIRQLTALQEEAKELSAKISKLKDGLKQFADLPKGEVARIEIVNGNDEVVVTLATEVSSTFDSQALREAKPAVYEQFLRDTYRQTIRL